MKNLEETQYSFTLPLRDLLSSFSLGPKEDLIKKDNLGNYLHLEEEECFLNSNPPFCLPNQE